MALATRYSGRLTENDRIASLIRDYRERGDRRAIEDILALHGKLLNHLVRRYAGSSGESYEDLLQVGYVGLIKAVNSYEMGSGAKFSSYAYAMIDGELRHHLRDTQLVKKPRWARSLYARTTEATTRLTAELGRPPLVEEIAREVNVSPDGVLQLMKLFLETNVLSLDGAEGEEGLDLSAIRSLQHETFSLPVEDLILLEQALESLTELQRKVVYLFFYKDLSQTEIGRRLGLSQRKIAARLDEAVERLNHQDFDVVLLDLSLPDSSGLETVDRITTAVPGAPVVVLSGQADEGVALQALQSGAQDYLIKGQGDGDLIARSIRYAIERQRSDEALRQNEERFRSLVQNASDIITILDADGTIRYDSPAIERMLGYEPGERVGKIIFDFLHPDDVERTKQSLARTLQSFGVQPPVEYRIRHKDGSWRALEVTRTNLLDDPAVRGVVSNARDVTERKRLEEQLQHQAFHDHLTGLANRALFMDRLGHALTRLSRRDVSVAVLFLDLDNFKVVNDSLGHERGDELLLVVGQRLTELLRSEDTVASLGGDEFTVILEDVTSPTQATHVAERITEAFRSPFSLDGQELVVTVSVGIALSTSGNQRPQELLRDADVAMYRAKTTGKARYAVFEPGMNAGARARLQLENDLRRAVERGEFRVCYQPKVDVESGRIAGVEALVRWEHPTRGLLPPQEFILVAEETGLIVPIGDWILREACRHAYQWQEQYPNAPPLLMNVNLSAQQFRQADLLERVAQVLRETGLNPSNLELEVTESVMLTDADSATETLRRLKSLGVRIALDDFGTGYSSLSYLRRFPVDTLKVDRSFVGRLGQELEDTAIVQTVITLAKTLGLEVVAEGVERVEQLAQLREMECDLAQGYYVARPIASESMPALLTSDSQPWTGPLLKSD